MSMNCGPFATPKEEYLKQCEDRRDALKQKISKLTCQLETLTPETNAYIECQKKLNRANSNLKDAMVSIYITEVQMNAKTHAKYAGLPLMVTISR